MPGELTHDARYAFRLLRRSPAFTIAAILCLALGVGANTAIFTVMNAVMLRMLPVRNPGKLVELLAKYPGQEHANTFSWQAYQIINNRNHVFSSVMATSEFYNLVTVRGNGLEPERVSGGYVTGNFFQDLDLHAAAGRLIGAEDDSLSSPSAVVVLSWSYWKSRFNADQRVIGQRIFVNDDPVTVLGVVEPSFSGLQPGFPRDIWIPLGLGYTLHPRLFRSPLNKFLEIVARLGPGVSLQQARADATVLYAQSIADEAKTNDDPHLHNWTVEVEPAGSGLSALRDRFAKPLVVIMGIVALLLLIACGGVAAMLLAHATGREREMALRISLGASRLRLLRQTLTESLLLSGVATIAGLFIGYVGTAVLARLMASGWEHIQIQATPDLRVLLFAALLALATGILFGVAPALYALRASTAALHGAASAVGESRLERAAGKALVITQVALSASLLSAASLFVLHLSNLENVDLGFRREHILLIGLDPPGTKPQPAHLLRTYQELLKRLEAIPGVHSATLSAITPISGVGNRGPARVEGYEYKPGERRFLAKNWVAPKYFETFGTPLLAGRDFESRDENRPPVAIVNEKLARYYFGNASPLGRHVLFDGDSKSYEIVGVVADAKYGDIHDAPRSIYLDAFQDWHEWSNFAVRTAGRPSAVASQARSVVRDVLRTAPIVRISTMSERVDESLVAERLMATLSGWFGALAGVMVAISLYGLLAYRVARRTTEIGVRMALGALRRNIICMVAMDALTTVCVGMLLALPLIFWIKKLVRALIPDAEANSVIPFAFAAMALIAIAALASSIPGKRAASVNPMRALRHE